MQQQHTWSGSQFYPHFVPWSGSIDATVWETFRGKPATTGCSQQGAASTGCSMSSLWSGFQIWPVLSNFEPEYMAFMSQLSQLKMAIKWSWSSQHRPMVPKLGWWLSSCPRHTLYHSSERQAGAGAVWCSSHRQNPLAYSLSNWNTNVFHLYSKSEFPGYMFMCHPCVIHPCHSMSMVFHGWVSHFITGCVFHEGSMNQWDSSTRPWNSSSSQVAVRWSSWFWCPRHFFDGPLGSLQKTTW